MIPLRRLELEGGEHLVEVPVFGLLPLTVLGQLALEKVRRGRGAAGRRRRRCHLIAVLHVGVMVLVWVSVCPRTNLSTLRD